MRIAVVIPGFSRNDDDWSIPVLRDVVSHLGRNHDVKVYTTCYPFEARKYIVKGVAVQAFGNGRSGRLAWAQRQYRATRALVLDHNECPIDLVHGFWANYGGVVAAMCKRRLQLPVIVTVMAGELTHDAYSNYGKKNRPIAGRLARFGAAHADLLHVYSRYHAALVESEGCGREIRVIPFGTDTSRFSSDGNSLKLDGEIPILCVASLVPVKCHLDLLQAFTLTRQRVRGVHLHIVGDGPLEGALRRMAGRLGVLDAVTFHGSVDHGRLPQFYRGARFCVLASAFESHGMVILEAAACGRVTVGTAVGSMPEFCSREFLVEPGDTKRLAEILETIATDKRLRGDLARAAAARINDGYNLDQSVAALEELYAQTIANVAGSR